ncbi:MAG: hypothetical protein JNL18_24965 [Planctomycetaceae bacterium]|nr:hypothetical protein [Planctomycetaceae bacterium]
MSSERVHIFGIRHHGPGSARSLERALEALQPDCLLIEGPPDAEEVLALAVHEEMEPPVALLVYVPDEPRRAAFYPFAAFSPEWRAIRYGLRHGVPTRFMDLPQWHQLAGEAENEGELSEEISGKSGDEETAEIGGDAAVNSPSAAEPIFRRDPLGLLAEAAGFSDGERWWDYLIESRRGNCTEVFTAVREAMTALRDDAPAMDDLREFRREAYMRKTLRAALKEGFERIAVVCGAWHAPALDPARLPPAAHDNSLLAGLKKVKTAAAWSPWTYDRLASGSGYGAGVVSPAWYELLWSDEQDVAVHWLTRVAQVMRSSDLDASPAHLIEAVRLAESLAAMRERPLPGLEELDEAALSVLCNGQQAPMALVRRRLIVGDRLGAIPAEAPMAPLQRDLLALQKRLRLPATSEIKKYDLDLRKPNDLARSCLLHRLNLLDVPWGDSDRGGRGGKGTFHEYWQVQWAPELAVKLIEASRYGNTIEAAATARVKQACDDAATLAELTELLSHALLAELPLAVKSLVAAIQRRASVASDVPQLMAALPALARTMRYGNVRQTDATLVDDVIHGVVERICIGLPRACHSINDDAAGDLFTLTIEVGAALDMLSDEGMLADWYDSQRSITEQSGVHPLLRGRAVRTLHDAGRLEADQLHRVLALELSPAVARTAAAAWIEGFLRGSGLMLIHDLTLWNAIDGWVASLSGEAFTEVLPLLRRTFATFETAERRQMGERVKRGVPSVAVGDVVEPTANGFNFERAAQVLPLLAKLLGREVPQ